MPLIIAAMLRQVLMAAITVAAADLATRLLSWINDALIDWLKAKFGLTEDDATIMVANEILDFMAAVTGAAVALKSRLPMKLADRLGFTTKGYVKRTISTGGQAKIAAAAASVTKAGTKDLATKLLKIVSFPAAIIWTVKAAADIIEPGAYQTEQINAIYRSLGIPFQYPEKVPTPQPGPFDTAQWRDFLAGIKAKNPVGLSDPYAGQTKLFSESALVDIANAVYGDALADGKTPTVKEFGPMVARYVLFSAGSQQVTTTYGSSSAGTSSTSAPVGTVPTQIKIYTGVVANGSLGTPQEFIARPDDMIQNADELKAAAKNNLAALYQALPGRFYYEIAIVASVRTRAGFTIKGAPVQVVSSYTSKGTPRYKTIYHKFAVMRIFVTDRNGRNIKLEEITLGPVNVVDFQPTPNQLEKIADAINPETFTGDINEVRQIVTSGSVSVTPTSQYVPAPAPAPAGGTVTPQASSAYVQQSATVSATPPPAPPPVQASSPAPAPAPVNVQIAKSLPLNEAAGVAFSYGGMGTTTPAAIAARHGVNLEDLYAVNANWGGYGSMRNYSVMDISYLMRNANIPKINIPYPRAGSVAPTSNPQLQAAATLSEAYAALGLPLPALQLRASLYQSWNLGAASTYAGTAEQNNKLLAEIKRRGAVA